jgi:Concanavalin A-like lectin/glucanases superfamily
MQEKKCQINKVYLPDISRLFVIFGISLLFIQFLSIPVLARSVDYFEGYNVITYDDGSKDIIDGALNFLRYDGVWRPNEELNISNGSWPYLYSGNTTTANFKVDDTTLSIPKNNTKFTLRPYSVSYNIIVPKSDLQGNGVSLNSNSASIHIPYNLKSKKPKTKYKDRNNIRYGRLHFKAGSEDIAIHDDTLRNYTEGGEIIQDVTYLFPDDYNYGIDNNGEILLEFKNGSLNKLKGNVTIEIRTWDIIGPNNWGGKVAFSQTSDVKATGNVELKQKVNDAVLYTRFDENGGTIIHNENTSNVLLGNLLGVVGTSTWTAGKYGQAIHFDGVKNKVLFNDHPAFRLPGDFVISFYIRLTSDVNNLDTDITRKGSTATANPDQWWKVEIKNNKMQGIVFKGESSEIAEKDTVDRRNGNWYFVAYTRVGTTCSLIITPPDGYTVASRTNCKTNAVNSAQLAIGAKDTESSGTGMDYTHGTIDEVRFFNHSLSASNLTSIRNNEHFTTGTVTRNLVSIINASSEIKELGCYGTWDSSITKVDVMASDDNSVWTPIKLNAAPNVNYAVDSGNNYKYSRCSLSTTDSSKTPAIQSMRANIGLKAAGYINGTIKDSSTLAPISGVKVTANGVSKTTNAGGFYSFAATPGTTYNLTVTLDPTYSPQSASVTATQGTVLKDFSLVKKPTGTITGSVNKV